MSKEVPVCSIIGCPNSEKDTVKSTVYYYVPKENSRARYWGRVLKGFTGDTPLLQALICMNHFETDAFVPKSIKLTESAIPTLFPKPRLPEPPLKKIKISSTTSSTTTKRERAHDEIKHESIDIEDSIENNMHSYNEAASHTIESVAADHESLTKQLQHLKSFKKKLLKEHAFLLKQDDKLMKAQSETDKKIKSKDKDLNSLPEYQLELLKKCFSPTQILHFIGKSKTRWSVDDLATAYTISSLTSRDFYLYLRRELKFPLPSLAVVYNCYQNMEHKRKSNNGEAYVEEAVDFEKDE